MSEDFSKKYFSNRQESNHQRRIMHALDYEFVVSRIQLPSKARILDFGCADGSFLSLFARDDAELYGIEINQEMANKARERDIRIIHEIDESEHFDLILFRGVLQHISNQSELLDKAVKSTGARNGTIAILQTPNSDSFLFRRFQRLPAVEEELDFKSLYLIPSASSLIHYFGRRSLATTIQYPYFRTPYARPLVDFYSVFIARIFSKYTKNPFPKNMFNLIAFHAESAARE
jgi:2-polyprenyl-3-methyl-5-hydroxy-6-metoxy-1,4-benzoquinol methylase